MDKAMRQAVEGVQDQAKSLIRWMDAFLKAKKDTDTTALCGDMEFMDGAVADIKDNLATIKKACRGSKKAESSDPVGETLRRERLSEQLRLAGLPEISEADLTGVEPSEQKKIKAALEKAFKQIVDLVDPKGLDPKAQSQFTAYLRVLIDYFMGGLYEQRGTASGLPPLTEAEKVNWEKLAKRCCNLVDAFKSLCDYALKADKGDAAARKNFTDLLNLVTHDYAAIIQAKDALMFGPGGPK